MKKALFALFMGIELKPLNIQLLAGRFFKRIYRLFLFKNYIIKNILAGGFSRNLPAFFMPKIQKKGEHK